MKHLKRKLEANEAVVTRYGFADTVYAKVELDVEAGIVNLWLGANVMLEYTYDEAIALLSSKEELAKKEFNEVSRDARNTLARLTETLFVVSCCGEPTRCPFFRAHPCNR